MIICNNCLYDYNLQIVWKIFYKLSLLRFWIIYYYKFYILKLTFVQLINVFYYLRFQLTYFLYFQEQFQFALNAVAEEVNTILKNLLKNDAWFLFIFYLNVVINRSCNLLNNLKKNFVFLYCSSYCTLV